MHLREYRVWCQTFLLFACVAATTAQQAPAPTGKKCVEPQLITDAKYSPGQVWSYRTRDDERSSTITILRIESLPKVGTIVHVRVDGIRLKNCSGGPSPSSIGHAPFTKDALDRSVTKLLEENQTLPSYEEGYNNWRQACGGVYTTTVADMVKVDEATFNSGASCPSQ